MTAKKKLSMEQLNRMDEESFKNAPKAQFAFILNDIRSLQNVGSTFRTGDAFRIDTIYLCGITGKPPHRDIRKTALGATETVNWEYWDDISHLVDELNSKNWVIISIEQTENSTFLDEYQFEPNKKYAFVLGNEVFGVAQNIIDKSSCVIEIPQFGTKHSLNVAVTAGIIAWDFHSKTKGITLKNPS